MVSSLDEAIQAYELALMLIHKWGGRIAGEECEQIAHHALIGDQSWLLAWQEPTE